MNATTGTPIPTMPRTGDPATSFTAATTQGELNFPVDWRPGDDVIGPPTGSCGSAQSRMADGADGAECRDWFFCTEKLDAEEVESRIRRH
jgi:hypothetical protein